jgi:hypothetical protein
MCKRSFIINKNCLSSYQLKSIREHGLIENLKDYECWVIEESPNIILGYTEGNFNISDFLKYDVGLNESDIKWGKCFNDLNFLKNNI